jgi:hypothetical protein
MLEERDIAAEAPTYVRAYGGMKAKVVLRLQ